MPILHSSDSQSIKGFINTWERNISAYSCDCNNKESPMEVFFASLSVTDGELKNGNLDSLSISTENWAIIDAPFCGMKSL